MLAFTIKGCSVFRSIVIGRSVSRLLDNAEPLTPNSRLTIAAIFGYTKLSNSFLSSPSPSLYLLRYSSMFSFIVLI
ncbi:ORF958 [White spot syndrome virus]|uniref:ORF958 n=1 Tax=White spot syndrome virus TaxID=342409 RepID=A0A2D3I6C6_9VIRU|nr:ORF958 [White spot syndrome virus]